LTELIWTDIIERWPRWRNWQTRGTQNPVGLTPREGSTPSLGTKPNPA
jgi:hypothetical protein